MKDLNIKKEDNLQTDINFEEQYKTLSHKEIVSILKKRDLYQESAKVAAIKEAISRGIINSEQDLLSEEYRQTTKSGMKLFPEITDPNSKEKTLNSISRVLILLNLLPVIYGFMSYAKGEKLQLTISFVTFFSWLSLSILFQKNKSVDVLNRMILFISVLILYSGYYLISNSITEIKVFGIIAIIYLLIFYLLFFAKSILNTKSH